MDDSAFDAATQRVPALLSRRRSLGLLSVLGLGAGLMAEDAEAKKRRKTKHKKKRNKKKKRPSPPTPPEPVAQPDAACLFDNKSYYNVIRIAQTFRAQRTGKLTSATVWIGNDVGADFDMEIWSTDTSGRPQAILAGATIADLPAQAPVSAELTVTFATPADVVAGLRYALVVTLLSPRQGETFQARTRFANVCADGMVYLWSGQEPYEVADADLRFETVVTA